MKRQSQILCLLFSFLICSCDNSAYKRKPLRYNKDDIWFSCNGYYKNDTLEVAVCFNENRDTILIDTLKNNKLNGLSREFYSSGSIKKIGKYYDDSKYGIWRKFYDTGELKAYEYWGTKDSTIYYSKQYHKNGILNRLKLPLTYRTNNEDTLYSIGVKYQLFIELLHSEFDSVNVYGIIDTNLNCGLEQDTVGFFGKTLYLEFTPQRIGLDSITGFLIENNALEEEEDYNPDDMISEQKFKYIYTTIEEQNR